MWYTIHRTNNLIEICNIHFEDITVDFVYYEPCSGKEYKMDSSQFGPDLKYSNEIFTEGEGIYIIRIYSEEDFVEYIFAHYPEVLESLIKDIKQILCKDSLTCKTCNNSVKTDSSEEDFLKETLNKAFLYYTLVGRFYQPYFNVLADELQCSIKKEFSCLKIQEFITGKGNSSIFQKKLLSLLYLTFYNGDKNLQKDLFSSNDIFQYSEIKDCLIGISKDYLSNICKTRSGKFEVGEGNIELTKNSVYTFTQKDFKSKLIPNYYTSSMDEIEYIKIGKIYTGDLSEFKLYNKDLKEGDIIDYKELGKGILKYYGPPSKIEYKHRSFFTFSIKTTRALEFSKLSKMNLITK